LASLIVTFDRHPLEVVNPPAAPRLLTLPDEKRALLAELGLDRIELLPFTGSWRASRLRSSSGRCCARGTGWGSWCWGMTTGSDAGGRVTWSWCEGWRGKTGSRWM